LAAGLHPDLLGGGIAGREGAKRKEMVGNRDGRKGRKEKDMNGYRGMGRKREG